MNEFRYTYSQLLSQSIGKLVASHYSLLEGNSCQFYVLGLHDNYLIECNHSKYILRVYRNDWRSLEEIHFELELELLAFLGERNALVACPLRTKNEELFFSVDSPEGVRAAALFCYADGYAPGNEISIEESVLLGKAVANVHQVADMFETSYTRQVLDVPYLLDESIVAIEPFLEIEALAYIKTLQRKIKDTLPLLSHEVGNYGVCIGDVNPTNFHINDKNKITLFDFDQCGYGYRAFEIGKFMSSICSIKNKDRAVKAFMDGYQKVRSLSQEEIYTIPYFEIISVIWVMAIHAYNADRIGYKWLEKSFWNKRVAVLRELDSLLFNYD
ncbi:MAG: hypothetical protein COC05_05010 [Gammaproteobacteria bacterium]|nr:MAG: hypothetical protein COC05_05010 [Gammaproteobacteria bacterium]